MTVPYRPHLSFLITETFSISHGLLLLLLLRLIVLYLLVSLNSRPTHLILYSE
jgi:hypothetical protein